MQLSAGRLTAWRAEPGSVLVVLALAGISRCYVGFLAGLEHIKPDTPSYLKMADAILAGAPLSDFPNGLPVLLAGLKLLVGGEHLVMAMVGLNVAMSTATVLLAFLIFRRVFDNRHAVIAALILALWPNQLNYVPQILSEVPCAFFLVAGLWAFVGGRMTAAAVLLCMAGLVRSTVMPLAPILLLLLLRHRRWHDARRFVLGFGAAYATNLAAQAAGIIAPPSNLTINLLVSIGSTSTEGIDFDLGRFSAEERLDPLATHIRFALEHPAAYAAQRLSALWEMWGPWPNSGAPFSDRGPTSRAMIGLRFPLVCLAAISLWHYRRRWQVLALGAPVIVLTVIHTAFFANARFSYPVEPLLAVLAVAGARLLLGRARNTRAAHALS
jgi:hypothetical protein